MTVAAVLVAYAACLGTLGKVPTALRERSWPQVRSERGKADIRARLARRAGKWCPIARRLTERVVVSDRLRLEQPAPLVHSAR